MLELENVKGNDSVKATNYTLFDLKKYLGSYNELRKENLILKNKINEYELLIQSPRGINYETDGRRGIGMSLPEQISKLVDLKNEYEINYVRNETICKEIKDLIYHLEDSNERIVLSLFYTSSSTMLLHSIASEISYSIQHVKFIKRRALSNLLNYVNENNIKLF